MNEQDPTRIPIYKAGVVVAHALVDSGDAGTVDRQRWGIGCRGYALFSRRVDGAARTTLMHRVVMGLQVGDGREVDHINGNKLDNRRANLRVVTRAENMQNIRSNRGATSSYRGVSWNKRVNKWRAQAQVDGRNRYVGDFAEELAAAKACARFRFEHMSHSVEDLDLL